MKEAKATKMALRYNALEQMYEPDETLPVVKSFARILTWENGIPSVGNTPILQESSLRQLVPAVLSLPYLGRIITVTDPELGPVDQREIEPEFMGLSNGEVMLIKLAQRAAEGDSDVAFRLLERILGKAKQQNENLNVDLTYTDFLDALPETQSTLRHPASYSKGLPLECVRGNKNSIEGL